MTSPETPGATGPAPGDPPEWGKSLSREIGDLERGAQSQTTLWVQRFGSDAFQNPLFVKSYYSQIRGHSIIALFKAVHAQDHRTEETSERTFEERFQRSAEGLDERSPGLDPVPLSPFHYLQRSIERARAQKDAGCLPDPEAVQRILTFVSQLKDLPALGAFRRDHLEPFPSAIVEGPSEEPAAAPDPVLRELPKGTKLGKVEVVRRIGVGGFAQVYQVFHPGLHEHRAAKLFTKRDLLGELPELLKAFYAEAQLQNKLRHPNIVRVLDVDEHDGYLVLHMEYIEGRNLRSLIEEKKKAKSHLSPQEILKIAIEAAKGLEHAHSLGIIHRDMKPENILIARDGSVKITDFGLAKTLNDSGQRRTTRLGNLMGTPQYMAPEQVFGDAYDLRLDLYSLGVVIYQMAWGQSPFIGTDPWKLLERQRDEKPVPLTELMRGFPPELDRIVMKLLEKKPNDRYSSASELVLALESCDARLSSPGHAPQRQRPGRSLAVVIASGLLAAAVPLVLWLGPGKTPKGTGKSLPAEAPETLARATPQIPGPSPEKPTVLEEVSTAAPIVKPPSPAVLDKPEPKPLLPAPKPAGPPLPAISLREQLRTMPLDAEEALFSQKILDLFSKHRGLLLERAYDAIGKDLATLKPERSSEILTLEIDAARDLVRLAGDLVQARWKDLAESKGQIRLSLSDGGLAEGLVERVDERSLTLRNAQGGEIGVLLAKIAPEELLRGKTIPVAEVAYQAVSGDAGQALRQALEVEKSKEKLLIWYPILVRLAHLQLREQIRETLGKAEAALAGGALPEKIKKDLPSFPRAQETLRALAEVGAEVLSLYPTLEGEFKDARRDLEALELCLSRDYSRVLARGPGTEAYPLAATLLLAAFQNEIEKSHDELIAKTGWLNYGWELRPDLPSVKERTQYWDLLEDGGCVLRDPKGPRSLLMGRPHPRGSEGLMIRFEFEPLGEGRAGAEWRFNLRREGGGLSYLRFDAETLSLWTLPLGTSTGGESLESVKIPAPGSGAAVHTCILIPGERLHVYLDGRIVANLKPADTILPSQPSLVVVQGKLSVRSIQVKKKASK